jgi:putative FmdB family regulatory protein
MPVYEFRCAECGYQFSLMRPMSQSGEESDCPRCKASGARRLMSSFAAIGTPGNPSDCGPVG